MMPIKLFKKIFFLTYIKTDQENIMICKGLSGSYTVVDLCQNRYYEYKDSYKYYEIDVDKILLLKKIVINVLLDIMMQIK